MIAAGRLGGSVWATVPVARVTSIEVTAVIANRSLGTIPAIWPNMATNIADIAGKQVPGQDARTRLTHAILYPNEYVVPGYPANVMPQNFGTLMDDVDLNSVVDYLLKQTANPAGATSAQPAATAATP